MTGLGLPPGILIDNRYQILKLLGKGAFGRTYLASDRRRFGELCVLKEFKSSDRFDRFYVSKRRELFRREATILHQLDHPQIPKFLAWFESAQRLFLVQEYVDGQTYWNLLRMRQRQGYAFTEAEVVEWLRALLPVLSYIHARNILHRDISPDNIMLPSGADLPVLIDFGVVKQVSTQLSQTPTDSSDMSIQASVAVGKFGYSPNEQLRMGKCSPSSDLYSLAVTAVVLLTGRSPNQLIDSDTLEWNWHSLVNIDVRLRRILDRMMSEKPQDRYSSAETVLGDLARLDRPISWIDRTWQAIETSGHPLSAVLAHSSLKRLSAPLLHSASGCAIAAPMKTLRQYAWRWGAVTLLGMGGMVGAMQLSLMPPLCHAISACSMRENYAEQYDQAVVTATEAQTSMADAATVTALESARDRLSQAILMLSIIPEEASSYGEAQELLAQYQQVLNSLEVRLERESQAASLFNRAESAARSATNLSQVAESLEDYKTARDQWNAALTLLQAVPLDSLLSEQVQQRSQDYRAKLNAMEAVIAGQETPSNTTAPVVKSVQGSSLPLAGEGSAAVLKPSLSSRFSSPPTAASPMQTPIAAQRSPLRSVATPPTPASSSTPILRSSGWGGGESGLVALAVSQSASGVQIRLDGAYVNRSGSYVANLEITNGSDRPFGFVPVFARIQDSRGQDVRSRVSLSGTSELIPPGEVLRGQIFVLDRQWNSSGDQNLTLVINEGTTGRRIFRIPF